MMRIDTDNEEHKEEVVSSVNDELAQKIKALQALQEELIKKKIYPCDVCGKTYKRENGLKKHNLTCVTVVAVIVEEVKPVKSRKLPVYNVKIEVDEFNKHKVDWIRRKIHYTKDPDQKSIYVNALTKYNLEGYWKIHRVN